MRRKVVAVIPVSDFEGLSTIEQGRKVARDLDNGIVPRSSYEDAQFLNTMVRKLKALDDVNDDERWQLIMAAKTADRLNIGVSVRGLNGKGGIIRDVIGDERADAAIDHEQQEHKRRMELGRASMAQPDPRPGRIGDRSNPDLIERLHSEIIVISRDEEFDPGFDMSDDEPESCLAYYFYHDIVTDYMHIPWDPTNEAAHDGGNGGGGRGGLRLLTAMHYRQRMRAEQGVPKDGADRILDRWIQKKLPDALRRGERQLVALRKFKERWKEYRLIDYVSDGPGSSLGIWIERLSADLKELKR